MTCFKCILSDLKLGGIGFSFISDIMCTRFLAHKLGQTFQSNCDTWTRWLFQISYSTTEKDKQDMKSLMDELDMKRMSQTTCSIPYSSYDVPKLYSVEP